MARRQSQFNAVFRPKRGPDEQIAEFKRQGNGKIGLLCNFKIGFQFLQDFPGKIDVLATDKNVVGPLVAFLKDAFGGNFARETVGQTAFTRNDDGKNAFFLVT